MKSDRAISAAIGVLVVVFGLIACSGQGRAGEQSLSARVSLEERWWGAHEFTWRLGEVAGLRWAIVDGISGRSRAGGENAPASRLAGQFEEGTGIKVELVGGVLVSHRPNEAERRDLEATLAGGGAEAVRAAWLLGWLKDARAWPALAAAAAGGDPAVALSAAHALRRLDGEENFDIRRWVKSNSLYGEDSPRDAGLTQVPLGAAFRDSLTADKLAALAKSPYVPLRESAARIAPGLEDGKDVAKRLAADPSLLVRQAAERALRAWETPEPAPERPILRPALDAVRQGIAAQEFGVARDQAGLLAAFGTDEDIAMMGESLTDGNAHFRNAVRSALVHLAGGEVAADILREKAARGRPWPYANHSTTAPGTPRSLSVSKLALAFRFDGEALSRELGPRLGTERWDLSSEFLLARFAGPSALPHLKTVFERRGFAAPLAAGYIGGPDGVELITPLLGGESLDAATAAARGLGESAQASAIPPLVQALQSPNRVIRSRAALALGRIGGPEAARALAELIEREEEYLPKRSAVAMLAEIATGDPEHRELIAQAEKELDAFVPAYRPVNPRFDQDFPTGKLVHLGSVARLAGIGETRCAVDARAGIWMRYGGCNGGYSNDAIGYDVASGQWFVIRPNETEGLFFNETRAGRGCSRGLVYCWHTRLFWMNNSTGFPSEMTPRTDAAIYDLARDRFDGYYRQTTVRAGEGPKWYIADSRRGHVYNEFMGPNTDAIDTRTRELVKRPFEGLPRLHEYYVFDAAGYDPVSDMILREVRFHQRKRGHHPEDVFGVWLLDMQTGTARKSKSPLPSNEPGQGTGSQGAQMIFDSLNRELVLLRGSGAYTYDRENDAWTRHSEENCRVVVLDFDPQHNVFLAIGGRWGNQLYGFRLKNVPVGTKAFFEPEDRE